MRIFCLFFFAILVSGCGQESNYPSKPNIVLILTDDQGWGDLSMNGNTSIATPNLDQLAKNGVVFDRFFVSPVCSPTRAEVLTGRYSVRGGVYSTSEGGERLDLDETTIADLFKAAGYQTAAYGKWHNGMQPPYHPNARGFDDFYGFCSGHWGNYFDPMLEHNGEIVKGEGFLTDDLTNHAIDFINSNQDQPFFLFLPYNTPHSPMQVPDRWWGKFANQELSQNGTDPDKEKHQHTRAALAMCENIDWNVGRIMDALEEGQLTEKTIVLFLSDNGPNGHRWNGNMKGIKGSTDEGGVRSPMIFHWKNQFQPGMNIGQIVGAIDLLPTLTDLAGIEDQTSKPLDGISLKPLLEGQVNQWPERFIINHWNNRTSVRSQNYRLDQSGLLFDMVNDPNQTQDIRIKEPAVFNQLMTARLDWEEQVLGELFENNQRPFLIGHPDFTYTQIPARDGKGHGGIERSNRWPNCSFFTNWTSPNDSITWEAELLADGRFEVILYYTCPIEDIGSTVELSFGQQKLTSQITEAHDPPLKGMENDRYERGESYVKDFKPLSLGTLDLQKGASTLTLKAIEIPGNQVMDFRLMLLKRI